MGNLLGFMHAYNLRFGVATTPEQRQAYSQLFTVLDRTRDQILAEAKLRRGDRGVGGLTRGRGRLLPGPRPRPLVEGGGPAAVTGPPVRPFCPSRAVRHLAIDRDKHHESEHVFTHPESDSRRG